MVRRHIVRGYQDRLYYAETTGNSEKIYEITMHPSRTNETAKSEVFQLSASWIVAFEADFENV
jgi:hypothetical protein